MRCEGSEKRIYSTAITKERRESATVLSMGNVDPVREVLCSLWMGYLLLARHESSSANSVLVF